MDIRKGCPSTRSRGGISRLCYEGTLPGVRHVSGGGPQVSIKSWVCGKYDFLRYRSLMGSHYRCARGYRAPERSVLCQISGTEQPGGPFLALDWRGRAADETERGA